MNISVKDNQIILDGKINVGIVKKVDEICLQKKRLYYKGYEYSRKDRKKFAALGTIFKYWSNCPVICITYTTTVKEDQIVINALLSEQQFSDKTSDELNYWLSQWQQDVVDALIQIFG